MKVTDLDYYVKFIFQIPDEDYCISTTDREMLNFVRYHNTETIPLEYKIGDIISFIPEDKPLEIIDIWVRQLVEDLNSFNYGIDGEDCTSFNGEPKKFLFSIKIKLRRV